MSNNPFNTIINNDILLNENIRNKEHELLGDVNSHQEELVAQPVASENEAQHMRLLQQGRVSEDEAQHMRLLQQGRVPEYERYSPKRLNSHLGHYPPSRVKSSVQPIIYDINNPDSIEFKTIITPRIPPATLSTHISNIQLYLPVYIDRRNDLRYTEPIPGRYIYYYSNNSGELAGYPVNDIWGNRIEYPQQPINPSHRTTRRGPGRGRSRTGGNIKTRKKGKKTKKRRKKSR